MMDQYDSQSWIDNTHLSHEPLKKWMEKIKESSANILYLSYFYDSGM